MKITVLRQNLIKSPYLKNFSLLSLKSKDNRYTLMNLFLSWMCGGEIDTFLAEYLQKTVFGKGFLSENVQYEKFIRLVGGLKYLHESASASKRSRIISLASVLYRRTELLNLGFKVSKA